MTLDTLPTHELLRLRAAASSTEALLGLRAELAKYSEDEPRDGAGKWTDGGSAGQVNDRIRAARERVLQGNRDANKAVCDRFERATGAQVTPGFRALYPTSVTPTLARLSALAEQFPQVKISSVDATRHAPGDPQGWLAYSRGQSGQIVVNERSWNDLEGLRGAPGWRAPGTDNVDGVLTHEFGHLVDAQSRSDPAYAAWRANYVASGTPVSGYARADTPQTPGSEKVAELFAATYTPGATPVAGSAALRAVLGKAEKRAGTVRLVSGGARRDRSLNPIVSRLRDQLVALAAEHSNRPTVTKYSEDEPRDDEGRWTDGGGGGAAGYRYQKGEKSPQIVERFNLTALRGVADSSLGHCQPSLLGPALEQLSRLQEQYPNLRGPSYVHLGNPDGDGTIAATRAFGSDRPTVLAERYWRTGHEAWATSSSWWTVKGPGGVMAHEWGHTLVGQVSGLGSAIASFRNPSGYGSTSPQEKYAEWVAAAVVPDSRLYNSPEAQQIRSLLAATNKAAKASSAGFSDAAKKAIYAAYLAAAQAGYTDSGANPDDWDQEAADATAETATAAQGGFLDRLAALLIGGALTAAAIDARMGQYAATANPIYEQGFATGVGAQGDITTATWHTTGDGEVCGLCDARDGTVWQGDEPHPYPGEGYYGDVCEGGPNCRCELWYDVIPGDSTDVVPEDIAAAATADLLKLRADLLKYSPDQPRDENGRFTAGVSDADYAHYGMNAPSAAQRAAERWYDDAAKWTDPEGAAAMRAALAGDYEKASYLSLDRSAPFHSPEQAATSAERLVAVVNKAEPTERTLYRGVGIAPADYPAFKEQMKPGALVDMNLSSWTPAQHVAQGFATNQYETVPLDARDREGLPYHQTIFELLPGAHAENISAAAPDFQKFAQEHLTLGRFEVVSASSYPLDPSGIYKPDHTVNMITLRQVGTLSADQLVGTKVAAVVGPAHLLPWLEPYLDQRMVPPKTVKQWLAQLSTAQLLALKYSDDEPRDDHGRWTGGGGGLSWSDPGERPGYGATDDSMTDEQKSAIWQETADRRAAWGAAMARGVAIGAISPQDAEARGWYSNTGQNEVAPLPDTLYHATTAMDAVLAEGLKTRDELGGKSALGGGESGTISFTTDPAVAGRIAEVLAEAHNVATGDISVQDLVDRAKAGGFYDDMVRLANGPEAFDRYYVRDMKYGQPPNFGASSLQEMVDKKGDLGWVPAPDSKSWMGGAGQMIYTGFERPMTPSEKDEARLDLYRQQFLPAQEYYGKGPMDPLIWGPSVDFFKSLDPAQIGVVQATPIPGAMGFQKSGLGEWRTWSGEAVTVQPFSSKITRKYSEDQPRDDHGRWTDGGAGDSGTHDSRVAMMDALTHFASARDHAEQNRMAADAFEARTGTVVAASLRAAADPAAFRSITGQLVALEQRFPSVHVDLIEARPLDATGRVQAEFSSDGANRVIAFDTEWAGQTDLKAEPGWHPPGTGDTWEGLTTHEYGHAVQDVLSMQHNMGSWMSATEAGPDPAYHTPYGDFLAHMNAQPPVSGYGATDPHENFADLFAATYYAPNAQTPEVAALGADMRTMLDNSALTSSFWGKTDFYTDEDGVVHPIAGSDGYDPGRARGSGSDKQPDAKPQPEDKGSSRTLSAAQVRTVATRINDAVEKFRAAGGTVRAAAEDEVNGLRSQIGRQMSETHGGSTTMGSEYARIGLGMVNDGGYANVAMVGENVAGAHGYEISHKEDEIDTWGGLRTLGHGIVGSLNIAPGTGSALVAQYLQDCAKANANAVIWPVDAARAFWSSMGFRQADGQTPSTGTPNWGMSAADVKRVAALLK